MIALLLTWPARTKRRRLYAAPAHAVFATTPVVFMIRWFNGKMRKIRGMYWIKTNSARVLLAWSALEFLVAGITNQITSCATSQAKQTFVYKILKSNTLLRFLENHSKLIYRCQLETRFLQAIKGNHKLKLPMFGGYDWIGYREAMLKYLSCGFS